MIYTYCHPLSLHAALPISLQTGVRADALKSTWRESWTPARIIIAGLAAGFLAGRADPARVLKQPGSGGRWIQLVGALSGLAASRSEEHTSELQSLMRISYAVFCLKKNK